MTFVLKLKIEKQARLIKKLTTFLYSCKKIMNLKKVIIPNYSSSRIHIE